MSKSLRLSFGLILLAVVGCQNGVGVMSYDRGTAPAMAAAPQDGEYALYESYGSDPKLTYALKKGDPIGFKVGKTGEIIVVAGAAEVSEPDSTYVWRRNVPGEEGNK